MFVGEARLKFIVVAGAFFALGVVVAGIWLGLFLNSDAENSSNDTAPALGGVSVATSQVSDLGGLSKDLFVEFGEDDYFGDFGQFGLSGFEDLDFNEMFSQVVDIAVLSSIITATNGDDLKLWFSGRPDSFDDLPNKAPLALGGVFQNDPLSSIYLYSQAVASKLGISEETLFDALYVDGDIEASFSSSSNEQTVESMLLKVADIMVEFGLIDSSDKSAWTDWFKNLPDWVEENPLTSEFKSEFGVALAYFDADILGIVASKLGVTKDELESITADAKMETVVASIDEFLSEIAKENSLEQADVDLLKNWMLSGVDNFDTLSIVASNYEFGIYDEVYSQAEEIYANTYNEEYFTFVETETKKRFDELEKQGLVATLTLALDVASTDGVIDESTKASIKSWLEKAPMDLITHLDFFWTNQYGSSYYGDDLYLDDDFYYGDDLYLDDGFYCEDFELDLSDEDKDLDGDKHDGFYCEDADFSDDFFHSEESKEVTTNT